jgi:epoxide hydrolase-like predicted phosphatase
VIKAVLFDCYGVVLDVQTNKQQKDVISFIASLKDHYKTGLVSNVVHRSSIERHFSTGELDTLFNTVIASGEIGFEKPEPAIYELAAQYLGVETNQCLFVDDIQHFCQAAEKVGMKAIHFESTEAGLNAIRQALEAS